MNPIERKAEEVIEETGLLFVPTKVISIAHFYGFEVYDLDNIDDKNILAMAGISEKYKKVILMNSKFSDDEKRYAIAHELGHYILAGSPENDYVHINSLDRYNEKERDAFIFASALLMPKNEVKRVMKKNLTRYPTKMTYITALFGVPEEIAEFRLKRLSLWERFV